MVAGTFKEIVTGQLSWNSAFAFLLAALEREFCEASSRKVSVQVDQKSIHTGTLFDSKLLLYILPPHILVRGAVTCVRAQA